MTTPTREQAPIHPHTMSVDGWHEDERKVILGAIEAAYAAARAQALDEAVAACDGERLHDDTGHPTDIGYMQAIGDCKSAIQTLKGKP